MTNTTKTPNEQTLEGLLDDLKSHLSRYDYINIIYGNAWEVQFVSRENGCTEIDNISLKNAVIKVLERLK